MKIKKIIFVIMSVVFSNVAFPAINENTPMVEIFANAAQGDAESQYALGDYYERGGDATMDNLQVLRWLEAAQKNGSRCAFYMLGLCSEKGFGVPQSFEQAAMYYRAAGVEPVTMYPPAAVRLAYLYYEGLGVLQSYRKAAELGRGAAECAPDSVKRMYLTYDNGRELRRFKNCDIVFWGRKRDWYRTAAEKGVASAQYNMAYCMERMDGRWARSERGMREIAQWYMKAGRAGQSDVFNAGLNLEYEMHIFNSLGKANTTPIYWFKKAADQGYTPACVRLGLAYLNGKGVAKSDKKAGSMFFKAAQRGNSDAQFMVALFYLEGRVVKKSENKAAQWAMKSAEQGNANAQFMLGNMYYEGQGVSKSLMKSVEWMTKAASQGAVGAQNFLGYCYEKGVGVPQSYEKAVAWYRKAADLGHAPSQYSLGCFYLTGKGVAPSDRLSLFWFRKAADQGNAIAQCQVGIHYARGIGVEKSYSEAVVWYRKAVNAKDPVAMYKLGECYEKGLGVDMSTTKALALYEKAAQLGVEDAVRARARLMGERDL